MFRILHCVRLEEQEDIKKTLLSNFIDTQQSFSFPLSPYLLLTNMT